MSGTYADVDRSGDPAEAVRWQDRVDSWPQIRAYALTFLVVSGRVPSPA